MSAEAAKGETALESQNKLSHCSRNREWLADDEADRR